MLDIGYSELLLIAVVTLVVIGPKDLPRVMRTVGGWVGKARAMTRHVRSGFDTMMREAELDEMQKQWAKHNAEIMAATPPITLPGDWMATSDAATAETSEANSSEVPAIDATAGEPMPVVTPDANATEA